MNDKETKHGAATKDAAGAMDSRRVVLTALLGGIGVTALQGCVAQGGGESETEPDEGPIDDVASALTGTTFVWADTIGITGALRGIVGTAGKIAIAEGYWAAGDGGGGVFYWSTGSELDNGGTYIIPSGQFNPGPGWKRIHNGVVSVRWFGAKGDGVTDDLAAIQGAAAVAASGGSLYFPPGTYLVSAEWAPPHTGLRVFGAGQASTAIVAKVGSGWGVANKAVLALRGVNGCSFCDITIDANSTARAAANAIDFNILLAASSNNVFERVTFKNTGLTSGTPTGPVIEIAAKDVGTDLGGAHGGSFVGTSSGNVFRDCTISQASGLRLAFAVRIATDWTIERAKSAFTHHAEANLIENLTIASGIFAYDCVELAGGGTRGNTVRGGLFSGVTSLAAVTTQKGCYDNLIEGVTAKSIAKDTVIAGALRLEIFADFGSSATYRTERNKFSHCVVEDCGSNAGQIYDCGLEVGEQSDDAVFDHCSVNGITAGTPNVGTGIVIGHSTNRPTITNCNVHNVTYALLSDVGGAGVGAVDVSISGCVLASAKQTASLAAAPALQLDGLMFTHNRCSCADATAIAVVVATNVKDAVVDGNRISGGLIGLSLGALSGSASGNIVSSATSYQLESTWDGELAPTNEATSTTRDLNILAGARLPRTYGRLRQTLPVAYGGALHSPQPVTFWDTSAPTGGAWKVGDTVWSSAPAQGQPIGWKCVAAGTPGTWVAMANL